MTGKRVSLVSSARSNACPRFCVRNRNASTRCAAVGGLKSLKASSPASSRRLQNFFQAERNASSSRKSPNLIVKHPKSALSDSDRLKHMTQIFGGSRDRGNAAFLIDSRAQQFEIEGAPIPALYGPLAEALYGNNPIANSSAAWE